MDRQQGWHMDDKEEILEQLRQGLKNMSTTLDPGYGAIPPTGLEYANVTIGSGLSTTYTLSNLGPTTSTISVSPTWLGSNGTTGGFSWSNAQPSATVAESGKLSLHGNEADIEINGASLLSMIQRIEQRLNILSPNKQLEEEWEQLKELGEQYRALEKKLTEQGKMWETLKKMPPPEIK
jgi:hypothetical protein